MLALLPKNELYKAVLKQKLNHPFYFAVLRCFYPVFADISITTFTLVTCAYVTPDLHTCLMRH